MVSPFTKETMQKRFWELEAAREKVMEELAPLRDKQNELTNQVTPFRLELNKVKKEIIAITQPRLSDIDAERAILARALGNKVGERPDDL